MCKWVGACRPLGPRVRVPVPDGREFNMNNGYEQVVALGLRLD